MVRLHAPEGGIFPTGAVLVERHLSHLNTDVNTNTCFLLVMMPRLEGPPPLDQPLAESGALQNIRCDRLASARTKECRRYLGGPRLG